jgi:hypothetical protein
MQNPTFDFEILDDPKLKDFILVCYFAEPKFTTTWVCHKSFPTREAAEVFKKRAEAFGATEETLVRSKIWHVASVRENYEYQCELHAQGRLNMDRE